MPLNISTFQRVGAGDCRLILQKNLKKKWAAKLEAEDNEINRGQMKGEEKAQQAMKEFWIQFKKERKARLSSSKEAFYQLVGETEYIEIEQNVETVLSKTETIVNE